MHHCMPIILKIINIVNKIIYYFGFNQQIKSVWSTFVKIVIDFVYELIPFSCF